MTVLVVLLSASPAAAQDSASPSLLGQRVRARSCERAQTFVTGSVSCREATGDLIGLTPDSLAIRVADDSVALLSRAGLERLQRSAGIHRRTGRGAVIGGAMGLVLGLAAGLSVASECDDDPGCAWVALGAPLVTTAVGVGLGAGAGAVTRGEDWVRVGPEALSLTPLLAPGTAGVAVRLRF